MVFVLNYQIDGICAKLSSAIFALKSVKKILPLNIRKIVYESFVKSQLEYGILAWGSSTNNKIGKLFKLQKKAIQTLSDGYSQHTDPLFSKLGMLKLSDIHKLSASTFMYKYVKEKLPSSFFACLLHL